jgi:RNA polymerase sigma factor (sigma-70 family)
LERLTDENLVALAQRYTRRRKVAVHILALRYLEGLRLLIIGLCHEHKLRYQDIEDACQQAYVWTDEALARYDPEHEPRVAQFRTFLGVVVTSRVHDFTSALVRRRRHQRPLVELIEREEAEQPMPDRAGSAALATGPESDPVELAARREDRARVREALGRLDPTDRWLCRQVEMGTSIRRLARKLHVSRHEAARRIEDVLTKVRALLERPG